MSRINSDYAGTGLFLLVIGVNQSKPRAAGVYSGLGPARAKVTGWKPGQPYSIYRIFTNSTNADCHFHLVEQGHTGNREG